MTTPTPSTLAATFARIKALYSPPDIDIIYPSSITLTEGYLKVVINALDSYIGEDSIIHAAHQFCKDGVNSATRNANILLKTGFVAADVSAILENVEVEGHPYTGTKSVSSDGLTETYVSNLAPSGANYTATGTTVFNITAGSITLSFAFTANS